MKTRRTDCVASEIFEWRGLWRFDVDLAYQLIARRTIRAEIQAFPLPKFNAWNDSIILNRRDGEFPEKVLRKPGLVILFDQGKLSSDPERYRSRPYQLLIDGHHRLDRLAGKGAPSFQAWVITEATDILAFTIEMP